MKIDTTAFSDQIAALEATMGASASMAAAFDGELSRMRDGLAATGAGVTSLTNGIGGGLRKAFDGLVFDGASLTTAMQGVAQSMANTVYSVAMKPVQNAIGGFIASGLSSAVSGALPFANGGAFSQGRVMPFAQGGVVTSPTSFPMQGGMGLMGEAGPEAIMPLTRGADGRLGVRTSGGGQAVNVVMNISTPDVQGFQRSQGQIAAQVNRALAQGQRNQ